MLQLRAQGLTLAQIGARFGVSRQRVGQIVGPDAPGRTQVLCARREALALAARERSGEILEQFRQGRAPARIATGCGLAIAAVKAEIKRAAGPADHASRRQAQAHRPPRYSDQELIACVRWVAARSGRAPTVSEYALDAKEFSLPGPQTLVRRLGGWRAALCAADLQGDGADANRRPRRTRLPLDDEQRDSRRERLRDALRQAHAELGGPFSSPRYERFRRERHPSWPAAIDIVRELGCGRWLVALAAAGVPSLGEQRAAVAGERRRRVEELRRRGLSGPQISRELGCAVHTIRRDLEAMRMEGISARHAVAPG